MIGRSQTVAPKHDLSPDPRSDLVWLHERYPATLAIRCSLAIGGGASDPWDHMPSHISMLAAERARPLLLAMAAMRFTSRQTITSAYEPRVIDPTLVSVNGRLVAGVMNAIRLLTDERCWKRADAIGGHEGHMQGVCLAIGTSHVGRCLGLTTPLAVIAKELEENAMERVADSSSKPLIKRHKKIVHTLNEAVALWASTMVRMAHAEFAFNLRSLADK